MSEPVPYELYRVITDYEALQETFIDRIEDLNVSRITIDEAGGFTPGYSSKLLCRPPIKNLSSGSLQKMLKATGLVLVAVLDDQRFAPVKAQLSKRKKTIRAVARIKRVKGFFTKENASKHGKKRWDGIPDHVRTKMMRKVINARWRAKRRRGASLIVVNSASCGHDHSPSIPRTCGCPETGNQAAL